jgi:hypothetical protein
MMVALGRSISSNCWYLSFSLFLVLGCANGIPKSAWNYF